LEDKKEIVDITRKFEPYSDFNFVSMWTWDVDQATKLSILNGNLVAEFRDYIDGSIFWSFFGENKVPETAELLLKKTGTLKLIPEAAVLKLGSKTNLTAAEDPDNFDYILDIQKLCTMSGNKLGPKRNFVNRFNRMYGGRTSVEVLNLKNPDHQKGILDNFQVWEKGRNKNRAETERELMAVKRALESAGSFDLQAVGVFDGDKMIGFSINEIVQDNFAMIHYEKADIAFTGVFEYLKQQTAITLESLGCKYINYEQDLGLEGLKRVKSSYQPVKYLKKYTIYQSSDL